MFLCWLGALLGGRLVFFFCPVARAFPVVRSAHGRLVCWHLGCIVRLALLCPQVSCPPLRATASAPASVRGWMSCMQAWATHTVSTPVAVFPFRQPIMMMLMRNWVHKSELELQIQACAETGVCVTRFRNSYLDRSIGFRRPRREGRRRPGPTHRTAPTAMRPSQTRDPDFSICTWPFHTHMLTLTCWCTPQLTPRGFASHHANARGRCLRLHSPSFFAFLSWVTWVCFRPILQLRTWLLSCRSDHFLFRLHDSPRPFAFPFYKKIEKRQLWVLPCEWLKLNFASCVVHQIFTQIIVRPCSMFYPYEGYRSVTPLDAARVNRTVFHNHSVHWYYITLIRVGIILSTILLKSIVFMFTDGVKFNTSVVFLTKIVVACVIFIPGFSPCGGYWVW